MSTARNGPCPCGSGKKYKHCCEAKATPLTRNKSLAAAAIVVVIGGILLGRAFFASDASQVTSRPPGPAPLGQVWSQEHSHWHDQLTGREPSLANTGNAQPPGPVPEGQEWSEEHGHWHDIPGTQSPADTAGQAAADTGPTLIPQPSGPVPEGKEWSPTHGHWHTAPTQVPRDSLQADAP